MDATPEKVPAQEELTRLIVETDKLIEQKERVRKRTGLMIRLFALALIAVVGYFAARFMNGINSLRAGPSQVEMQKELEFQFANMTPDIRKELEALTMNVVPVYTEAMRKEFSESLPEIKAKTVSESVLLFSNVQSNAQVALNDEVLKFVEKYQSQLIDGQSVLNDPKKMEETCETLAVALTDKSMDLFQKKLKRPHDELLVVLNVLDSFPEQKEDPNMDPCLELCSLSLDLFKMATVNMTNTIATTR